MKNLVELNLNDINIYEKIADSKRPPRKEILINLIENIRICYDKYVESSSSLEELSSNFVSNSVETIEVKGCLIHCYDNSTAELNKLKKQINEAQPYEIRSRCQLCGIDSSSTLDHYLPKNDFPEYSVFSKNLVPCCNVCNINKGNKWIENGKRLFLNLYYDKILEKDFLSAKIIIEDDTPIVEFEIIDQDLNSYFSELISNHFKELNLFDRYKQEANRILSLIKYELKNYDLINSDITLIKKWLKQAADSKKDCYGTNSWKALIYDALAECDECIDLLCS